MRIVHSFLLILLIAVLSLTAVFSPVHSHENFEHFSNDTLFMPRTKRGHKHQHNRMHDYWYDPNYDHGTPLLEPGKFRNQRENQMLLRHESRNRSDVDCCPSVLEMVEPEGGKNQDDQYVELYRDGENRQRFYELSCHKDILGKPCRFLDRKLHAQSRCVQKYSYTYALVKDPGRHHHQRPSHFPTFPATPGGATFTLDYIKVHSGCSCVVTPTVKKKRDRKGAKRRRGDETTTVMPKDFS